MPRETLPQLTAEEARKGLRAASERLGLEFIEIEGVAPSFILASPIAPPDVLFFASWHAESLPVEPAAVEGAERLALAAALSATERARDLAVAVVVAPGATQGSIPLGRLLREHRARLRAPVAFWPRIGPRAPRRRRIFMGSRGRVVLGLWHSGGTNPYRLRDEMVEALRQDSYGPRPLDFELVHKLSRTPDAMDFLEEASEGEDGATPPGMPEEEARLTRALFDPRGSVVVPQVRHPDRPEAWLLFDIAENTEPERVLSLARARAEEARIEMAEAFPWDRIAIHHPSIQAEIKLSKEVSDGPEIWPSAPWMTPSGIFTRALGTPLAEWAIPVHPGVAIRFPSPDALDALAREVEGLIRAISRS